MTLFGVARMILAAKICACTVTGMLDEGPSGREVLRG